MPAASLLLLPLKPLLRLLLSVLALLPVLLSPPPMAARLSPLALPPLVPGLPTFALRPLAFLPTPSSAPRLPAAKRPASFPLALWERVGACPGRDPRVRLFRSRRHPAAPSHRAVPTAPQTPPKSTLRSLKSFLEKTLIAHARPQSPPPGTRQPTPLAASPNQLHHRSPGQALTPPVPSLSPPPTPRNLQNGPQKPAKARAATAVPPRPRPRDHGPALRIRPTPSPNRCPMSDFRAVVITDSTRDRGGPSHGLHRTFDRSPDVQTVALADPSNDHRDHWLKDSGAATGYADYRDMLAAESPDIAIIAIHRYHQERLQTFLDTIAAGVKGIVIEKPIASQPAHADQMVAAADAAGARVVLAHRGRENPAVREAKRQAATGKWGPLVQIKARGKGDHRCGVVDALVLGTHELNTMLYFAEANPISCWGTVLINGAPAQLRDAMDDEMYESGPQAGDRIFAEYTFPNGIIGSYESLPIGNGSNSGHALGCDLFFQNAVVTTRSKPDAEIHIFPEGDIFPQAEVGAWQPLLPDGWTPPASDIAAPYWADWPGRESTACSNRSIGAELVRCLRENTAPVYASGIHDAAVVVDMIIGPQRSHLEGRRLALPLEARGNPWEG